MNFNSWTILLLEVDQVTWQNLNLVISVMRNLCLNAAKILQIGCLVLIPMIVSVTFILLQCRYISFFFFERIKKNQYFIHINDWLCTVYTSFGQYIFILWFPWHIILKHCVPVAPVYSVNINKFKAHGLIGLNGENVRLN